MNISVSIIEDDHKTRQALVKLLRTNPALRCLHAYSRAEEALPVLADEAPDVLLVDINLPGMSGIECVTRLKTQMPELKVLMLTTYEDSFLIFNSLRAGASGYILKNRPPDELMEAIKQVYEGGAPMSMRVARKVIAYFRHIPELVPEEAQLSEREESVLELLAQGCLYKEIADHLGISLNTVRTYLKRIYQKLQVKSRTEAVAKFSTRIQE
jgi:DNA-binding NarL/FixJ family response regulator